MRHGLMLWRENELSADDVRARQKKMSEALAAAGLDALIVYTNHVRSHGVTYLTGFTPYWSDALLLQLPGKKPILATALSKRVGNWIRSVNPTAEIGHSPKPGRLVGEHLAEAGCKRVGVLELDLLPSGLAEEITSVAEVELVDASAVFDSVRCLADEAELRLVKRTFALANEALDNVDTGVATAGEAVSNLERLARDAGAEECYIAVAPDLVRDRRPGRLPNAPIGAVFAVRLSLAYNGVWVRQTRTFTRREDVSGRIAELDADLASLSSDLDLTMPLGPQLERLNLGDSLLDWRLEAPRGTLPLTDVATSTNDHGTRIPFGVLSLTALLDGVPVLAGGPVGLSLTASGKGGVA